MMVPSLSTSISSPALFKNRENGSGEEENDDGQLEQLQNQVNDLGDLNFNEEGDLDFNEGHNEDNNNNNNNNGGSADNNHELQNLLSMVNNTNGDEMNSSSNNNNNTESGMNSSKEILNDLFISSINVDTLLDDLDQLSEHSHASVSNNSGGGRKGGYDIKTQRSVGSKGQGSSSGSSPRSNSLRVYRTFPYRGDHHLSWLNNGDNTSDEQRNNTQQQLSSSSSSKHNNDSDNEKPKPSSTNGIRHSRKYKGLQQLDFLGSNVIPIDQKQQQPQPINDDNNQQVPQQEQPQIESNNSNNINTNNNNNPVNTNNNNTTNTTQWSELIESLGYGSQTGEQKTFGSTLDDLNNCSNLDLKDLVVDGIVINNDNTSPSPSQSQETDFSKIEKFNTISAFSPTTIDVNIVDQHDQDEEQEEGQQEDCEAKLKENKYQDNLNILNTGGGGRVCQADAKKKQILSRTITFADPSSIHSFFGTTPTNSQDEDGNGDAKVPNTTTTSNNGLLSSVNNSNNGNLNSTSSPIMKMDHQHKVSEQNRTSSKISLSTIFPKLPPFSNQLSPPTLSPSKYYFPLLQPEPTTLIRGFSSAADINKRGLKRAKKPMEMEDEYLTQYPLGDDDSQIALFAIFDGHSGKNCAAAAKEIFPSILLKYIQSTKNENGNKPIYDMRGVFLNAFKEVDAQLSKFEYEGATATVCLIWRAGHQRFVQSANVGDSTAFLSYGNETLFLSKDHRATDPEEIQRIKKEGIQLTDGQTRINGLMVSRALGDHFIKHLNCGLTGEPYVSPPISITPFHSHLIVASDGLWDVISGHRAMEIVKVQQTEEKMSNSLLQCAVGSIKAKDNISIIVVTLQ